MKLLFSRTLLGLPLLVLTLLLAQFLYFARIYSEVLVTPKGPYDLVLMYGGWGKIDRALKLTDRGRMPLYVSATPSEVAAVKKKIPSGLRVILDHRGLTTDENARFSAAYIRHSGFHRVALLSEWVHLPRALFLTDFYLLGSCITVIPCGNGPTPKDWWRDHQVWIQYFKFWGSLGRIVLHWFGIDNWPPPEWMP